MLDAVGCSSKCCPCCLDNEKQDDVNNRILCYPSDISRSDSKLNLKQDETPDRMPKKSKNYHMVSTVWNPDVMGADSGTAPPYDGYRSTDQFKTPSHADIQSFGTNMVAKLREKELNDQRVYAMNMSEPTEANLKGNDPVDTMISWTQQLQEQLRATPERTGSGNSTKRLITP
jgi:hypothetical protein